ncbi:unnamed protein product [Triticum turgidum subsp. durum]|uniref:DUF3511 domain protein n=1 Tax=Triticum turgidum subsp. durum TaxID=4567 RepID=A0A9R0UX42_TRITD|nr:unnamed protein product [Triticum turgidum subsp. durum]
MADYHRPYQRGLRPPPSSAPDPTIFHGNGYFSSVAPQANAYFSSAPKDGAFPGAGDRRIEIYTKAPPMKRRRRVASYKAYSVEGKVKSSLRRGLRWFKGKCSDIFHSW